jgi:branched-chain amino acid transport system ATP-binding protein
MEPILRVADITVRYGRLEAVSGAGIVLFGGTVTALLGHNGAGKSSFLQAMVRATRPSSGSVTLSGRAIDALDTTRRATAGLVLVPQGRQVFPRLTVRENLLVISDALGLPPARAIAAMQRFPILVERQDRPAGILSGGEQQMLALARALMTAPRVLLLDEPTLGLAPQIVKEVHQVIDLLKGSSVAVLIAEPSIRLIRGRVDRGYIMLRGRIVAEATSCEALEEKYVQQLRLKSPMDREEMALNG